MSGEAASSVLEQPARARAATQALRTSLVFIWNFPKESDGKEQDLKATETMDPCDPDDFASLAEILATSGT